MKLQKQISRKTKDTQYVKWVIIIPPERIKQLGWGEGLNLIDEVKGNILCVRAANEMEIKKIKEEPIYENFKNSTKNILERYPTGLTWSQIKDKLNYSQKAPNNKWVRKLEEDIGLKRVKSGGETIWKLEQNTIYTLGYEGLSIEEFTKKLQNNSIQQLIDIRQIPLSRKNGFSKGILIIELKKVGIRYKSYPSLGSPKELRYELHKAWDYTKFFTEYKEHVKDFDVQESIKDIEGLSKVRKTALLCFEKDYKTCHRSIISEELIKRGWKIIHL